MSPDRTDYLERAEAWVMEIREWGNGLYCSCTMPPGGREYFDLHIDTACAEHGDFETAVYHRADQLRADDLAARADRGTDD